MITKIKKKRWHLYSRFGFTLGEEVRVIGSDITEKETLTIVAIDTACHEDERPFLLSSTENGALCDLKSSNIRYCDVVYVKGARKSMFNTWVDKCDIEKIK